METVSEKRDLMKPRKSQAVTWMQGSNVRWTYWRGVLIFKANVRDFYTRCLFSSFVKRLLKLSTMCESPLHGPLDYVPSNVTELRLTVLAAFFFWNGYWFRRFKCVTTSISLYCQVFVPRLIICLFRRTKAFIAGHVWACLQALPKPTNEASA